MQQVTGKSLEIDGDALLIGGTENVGKLTANIFRMPAGEQSSEPTIEAGHSLFTPIPASGDPSHGCAYIAHTFTLPFHQQCHAAGHGEPNRPFILMVQGRWMNGQKVGPRPVLHGLAEPAPKIGQYDPSPGIGVVKIPFDPGVDGPNEAVDGKRL